MKPENTHINFQSGYRRTISELQSAIHFILDMGNHQTCQKLSASINPFSLETSPDHYRERVYLQSAGKNEVLRKWIKHSIKMLD